MIINKKIIIVLSITVIILIIITYVLMNRNTSDNSSNPVTPTPAVGFEDVIPGILVDRNDITPDEIDILAVSPADQTSNIVETSPIEITFTQSIIESDVNFSISPDLTFNKQIEGNKLIISPSENFQPSTLYTYRIEIRENLEKIRMYTFKTAGQGPLNRPDTAPSDEVISQYEESIRIEYPDIYLQNKTPYETKTFGITGTYSNAAREFQFRVLLKGANKNESRASFILWLQTLDLSDKQIESLDITYE